MGVEMRRVINHSEVKAPLVVGKRLLKMRRLPSVFKVKGGDQ